MRFFEITLIAAIAVGLSAASANAQTVAMAGSYGDANGITIDFPQHPPTHPCDLIANDAKCVRRSLSINSFSAFVKNEAPFVGVITYGAVPTVDGGVRWRAPGYRIIV